MTRITLVTLLLAANLLQSCRKYPSPEEAKKTLTGNYELRMPKGGCAIKGIRSDKLILHADGTMEQHVVTSEGTSLDSTMEKWEFSPSTNVQLNRIWLPDGSSSHPLKTSANLIVEFYDDSANILINPDTNCYYEKLK